MMESERILARAEEALRRHGMEPRLAQRARAAQRRSFFGKVKRIAIVAGLLTIGLPLWGLIIGPVGTSGLMIAVLAFMVASVGLMAFPRTQLVSSEVLPTTELALLPLRTEEWLAGQRRALPAPATKLVDGIGLKLEILAPQLQALDEREPVAADIRRLISDELPELVKGYQRVPLNLRREGLNGISPDKQLIDGLSVVDEELGRLSEQLASGDLNRFATQGRYLELKYQGDAG
jgi:hypothetical protein